MAKTPFPRHYLPMLTSTVRTPFNDPEWQYQVKWDDELFKWKKDVVIDGVKKS